MLKSNQKIKTKKGNSVFNRTVYLDYASATPLDPTVLSIMEKVLEENYANASSIHTLGIKNKKLLEEKRKEVAQILGAQANEIIFTSGATESNNLALLGLLKKISELSFEMHTSSPAGEVLCSDRRPAQGISKDSQKFLLPHFVSTNIEHPSVLEVLKYLEKTKKAEVTYVPVEKNGIVDPRKIKKAIQKNTILVSVMYANNEIGTIQPIREIAKEIRHYRKNFPNKNNWPFFHSDVTQAVNYLPITVEKLGLDLMSFNAGKIYGPKGVGVLYVKRKTPLNKILFGGSQELNLRPGTENLVNIVGLGEALKKTEKIKEKENIRLKILQDYFIKKLFELKNKNQKFSRVLGLDPDQLENFNFDFLINGDLENRLPNNINISFDKIPSDLLLIELSARNIYVSEKSACQSGDREGSYVLKAINNPKFCKKNNALRFSLGRETTKEDIEYVLSALEKILLKLKRWYTQ